MKVAIFGVKGASDDDINFVTELYLKYDPNSEVKGKFC